MDRKLAEFLEENANGEVYENYSGRGMYGETTTAVRVESLEDALITLLRNVEFLQEELEDIVLPNCFRTDNLGKDIIIY